MIRNPDVIVTVERGTAEVDVRRSYLIAEVRDYDLERTDKTHPRVWTDQEGHQCVREYVMRGGIVPMPAQAGRELERFAEDLQRLTDIETKVDLASTADGLHVLQVKGVDFYFYADGSGYDGWGRAL